MSADEIQPPVILRVQQPADPVGAVTEDDAARRTAAYPKIRIGAPLFGHAVEADGGRWQVYALASDTPQAARDDLAHHLMEQLDETTDPSLAAELTTALGVLDRGKVNEVVITDRVHRVVRVDTFARFGPDGPEPPRPTDRDPRDAEDNDSFLAPEIVIDPDGATGLSEAMLRVELTTAHYPRAEVPANVYAESVAAVASHPVGVILPTRYAAAESVGGSWRPYSRAVASPQLARDEIAFGLRHIEPRLLRLTDAQAAAYQQTADALDTNPVDDVTALGRHFRVTRIETLLRMGASGPEMPRPSDPDPDQPPGRAASAKTS
ncbi:hypothetical protein JNW91_00420 [Micromonospora sp. STR1_7]|uniref:PE-PGRS family protein n=1 Tax=Micromonospora parastrephiae TaxID=2806101 RepID=A0ABS1XML6_9ACTN|nr:DUF5954 family protein [Micromonospora parastrephiae]MBM0230467.1 hypothetical protein [Micromonospora parastrephiae]